MHTLTRWLLPALLALCAAAWAANGAYIAYLYPAGGAPGTVVRVTAGGQRLRGVLAGYVTGEGIHVAAVGYTPQGGPLNNLQQDELRKRVKEIIDARTTPKPAAPAPPAPPADPNKPAEAAPPPVTLPDLPELRNLEALSIPRLRALLDRFVNPNTRPKPPLAEEVTLEITLDADAAPGMRELRLRTGEGLSNPIRFQVGAAPEIREPDRFDPEAPALAALEAPATLNGQILPGQVDRFLVRLRAGQTLGAAADARRLIPYLADAVPGWFQAVLTLTDPQGREVAYVDDTAFEPDPLLVYTAPADGVYTLAIRDGIYRGREDFVYRIHLGDPAAVRPAPDPLPDGHHLSDAFPARAETEPNDVQPMPVALPVLLTGTIARPGDADVFAVTGRKGDTLVAEIYARRSGSPLDGLLRVLDLGGRVLAWNDDHEDKSDGVHTHHADPWLRVTLPADGTYRVQVTDTRHHGGADYTYTLRLGLPQPDVALRVTPSAVNIPAGHSAVVTVTALRRDGWEGDVTLALKHAPPGFTLEGGRIPAGQQSVRMTLSAPRGFANQPVNLELEASALIDGRLVTRPVVPADSLMQAFAYYHLVPAQQFLVQVVGGGRAVPRAHLKDGESVRIPAGGQTEVLCRLKPLPAEPLHFTLVDPPAGLTLRETKPFADGVILVLAADPARAGYADNLIVESAIDLEIQVKDAPPRTQRVSLGLLPAIPVEVVK